MRTWLIFALLAVALASASTAAAQRRRPRVNVAEVREALGSTDAAQVREAIETVGLSGSGQLVAPLADRIRRGLTAELLELAMDTLTILANPEAGPILFELATHRRADVRLKAVEAIIACEPQAADRVLVAALSDSDPRIRARAALGLGQLGARSATGSLFVAMDRGVMEAGQAIGQVASEGDVDRLLGYLGRFPFDALAPAFMEVLARDDLPEAAKLTVVARLAELATPEVKTFLEDFVASLPDGRRHDRIRQAAEAAILRIVS